MPVPVAGARLRQQIGGVGHILHPAGDDPVGRAGGERIMRQHDGLHAGAANLADGGGHCRIRYTGEARRLTRRRLAEAGWQHAAHEHLIDARSRDLG